MSGSDLVSPKEIAEALGKTVRFINMKATKEGWKPETVNKRGDRRFYMGGLPEDVRMAIVAHRARSMAQGAGAAADLPARALVSPPGYPSLGNGNHAPVPVGSPELAGWQNKIALAWADLIRAYVNEKNRARAKKQSQGQAAELVIKGYNTGRLLPNVFMVLGKTSAKSVERNLKKFRDSGYDYTVLAPRWGMHRGQRKVTEEEFNAMLSFALHPNKLRVSEVVRLTRMRLKKQGAASPSHEATLRRALMDWRKTNEDKWVFCREGEKALTDKVLPYIERDISLLDVGDVLVADGHKLNFNILHPFTGKPTRMTMIMWYDWASCMPMGWEIMPTENTQCIAAGLRHAILSLGKTPKIAYLDNGKAFKAKVFTSRDIDFEEAGFYGMFARLGMETIFAWPYNAQSKVVERFFGTFNELERLMPTYTGASIQDKPAHLLRNEKLHKKLHEKKYGGWVPTIEDANRIIAGWVNEYAKRPHQGLKGLQPGELLASGKGPGVDETALRYLMMSIEIKRVHQNGITFMGRNYYDDALYGYRDRVTVKYDFEDLSKVCVYDITGAKQICEAEAVEKTHPAAKLLGTKEDLALVKEKIQRKRALKKTTEKIAREFVSNAPELIPIPERVAQGTGRKARELPRAEAERIEAEAAQMKVLELKITAPEPLYMNEPDRYEALLEKECKGDTLEAEDTNFMRYFEGTSIYKNLKDRFDFLQELFIAGPEEEAL